AAVAAGGVAGAGAEEDAGQLAAVVENRAARIALAGLRSQLDHLVRKFNAGSKVLRAAAAGHPPIAAAVAADGERLAGLRSGGGDRHRHHTGAIDAKGGEVPVFVGLHDLGGRLEAVGEFNRDGPGSVADDMPVAND